MTLKSEAQNVMIFSAVLAAMIWVGKKLDKGWWRLLGRGSDR